MAIRTEQERLAALELALGTLEDLLTALDAVPHSQQSEAAQYGRAGVYNAVAHVRQALILASGPAEAVAEILDNYHRISAEAASAEGSIAVGAFEVAADQYVPGTWAEA